MAFVNISAFLEILVMIGVVLGIPLAIVAILTQRAVSGQFNFAPKALAFKAKKMNLITGLGRMFGTKSLVELGKAILKAGLLVGIAAVISVFTSRENIAITLSFTCSFNGINIGDLSKGSGWTAFGTSGDCFY